MGRPGGIEPANGVAAVVARARLRAGMTTAELASTLAVRGPEVAEWESGNVAVSPADLRRLNRLLVFTPSEVAAIEAETGILLDLAVARGSTEADHLRSMKSAAWLAAARDLNCPFSGGGFQSHRIEGWIGGYRVVVSEARRGGHPFTSYAVRYRSLDVGLRLRLGDWASHVASRFSVHSVVTGDTAFDALFVVKADDRVAASRLFTPATAHALVELGRRSPTLRVSDEELSCLGRSPRGPSDAIVIVNTTRLLVDVVSGFALTPSAGGSQDR